MSRRGYWLLAGFYGAFFAVLGVWIPYWPLYMSELGHGAEAIGLVTALSMGIKVLGAPLWGRMADRGSRRRVMIGTAFATGIGSTLFLLGDGLLLIVSGTIVFSLFQNGPLVLVEATTLEKVTRHQADYGRIRLWGSWGFVLFALGLGPLADLWGLRLVPMALVALLLAVALLTLILPEGERTAAAEKRANKPFFSRPAVRWFYLSTLLMQFSHGAYYGFMSLHLENNGFSLTVIGLLWSLGVVAEVVLMHVSAPLLARLGVSPLITVSLAVAALRWSIYAITLWWPLLIFGQILHAFTYGGFHIAAVRRAFEIAPRCQRNIAQAWYSALSFGVGGGSGLMLSGYLFEIIGAEKLFAIMAVCAALGVWVSWRAGRLFSQEVVHAH